MKANEFIVIHLTNRIGEDKPTKKLVFYEHMEAIRYIHGLREHETIVLFKKNERNADRRKVA